MPHTIALDVYGTLVDPLGIATHLAPVVGDDHAAAAALWRRTQLEYAFRRGLMGRGHYADFDTCTAQALRFTLMSYDIAPDPTAERDLLAAYRALPPFPDAIPGLERLHAQGHRLLAFSNGTEPSVRALLAQARLLPLLDGIVSVDPLRTFKPDPAVYAHLVQQGGRPAGETWLVTANAWDAIGAKAAGLRTAWLRRTPATPFDPWEPALAPDIIVASLRDLDIPTLGEPGGATDRTHGATLSSEPRPVATMRRTIPARPASPEGPPGMATTVLPPHRTTLVTANELATLPDDGYRYDLVAGDLIQMAPASAKHGKYALRFGSRLDAHVTEHDLGTVFAAETGFILARDPDTVLAPDVAFVRADRLPPEAEWEGYLALAPDLVVEVLSPSDTASGVLDKVLANLDAGVQLVVTLDPQRQIVIAYGSDRVARILTRDDTLDGGDILPGFRLPLAELFA